MFAILICLRFLDIKDGLELYELGVQKSMLIAFVKYLKAGTREERIRKERKRIEETLMKIQ